MDKVLAFLFFGLGSVLGMHVLIVYVAPPALRQALVKRFIDQPAPPAARPRRARKVDQFALCRINRLTLHHQRRIAVETKRETKTEMVSLTESRPAHDPQMLALAQLVRAKLVTQTAGLQTLYGVKPGDSAAYQQRVNEFRAALAYLNLHGTTAAPATTSQLTHAA